MEIRRVPASSGSRERRPRRNSHQGGKEARCPTRHKERTIQERGSQLCGTVWRLEGKLHGARELVGTLAGAVLQGKRG